MPGEHLWPTPTVDDPGSVVRTDDVDLQRDRALVERFQQGDLHAFDALYRRYFSRLTRFCQKRVRDPHDAEEIAQEAFTRALVGLTHLAGERRFYPWVTVIASRLCVDYHRQRSRMAQVAGAATNDVDDGTAEGSLDDDEDRAQLESALGRLTPRHREVLDLRERHGWSYERIAAYLRMNVGAVEALVFRARRALRREFLSTGERDQAWLALPGGAGLARRVLAVRARLPALPRPPLAAVLAPVAALVAGASAFLVAGREGGSSPSLQPPDARAAVASGARSGQREPSSTHRLASTTTPARQPPPTPATLALRAGPIRGPVVVVDDRGRTRDRARRQPIHLELPGVATVGVDPDAIVEGITRRLPGTG